MSAPVKPFSFDRRLKEIDRFFEGRGKEHKTMRRLVANLEKAGIPYAIVGGMAVNAHRYERTTKDVDVLLTPEGFENFASASCRVPTIRWLVARAAFWIGSSK